MKIFNKILVVALAGASLSACIDLNTAPLGGTITSEQKAAVLDNDPTKISAGVNGVFAMFSQYMNALGTSNGYHNDFGYPSIMLFTDCGGVDMVTEDIGYNWFSSGLLMDGRTATSAETAMIWNTMYNQIYSTKLVAEMIDANTKDPIAQYYLAQALAVRAFDYFILAQLYQFNYQGNENKPCVPLITDKNAVEAASEGCARATVDSVYAQIMRDIDKAVELLGACGIKRADKRYVSEAVALGLRARIELTMGKWDDALADADACIALEEATPLSIEGASKPGFNVLSSDNWLWGISIAETDRVVTSGIVNWPSHMGSLNYGYASVGAWKMINKALFNSISSNDVRKGWWLDGSKTSPILSNEQAAYVASAKCPAYTQVKFDSYKSEIYSSTNACDIPLMRIEEIYLIKAEAEAMAGNPAVGASTLATFVSTYRNPSYTFSAATAEAVQEEVWKQRRIELWGEGLSYYDIMRLNKGIDRRGGGYESTTCFNVEPGDNILVHQLPKAEMEGNKKLGENDNNPIPTTPTPVPDDK